MFGAIKNLFKRKQDPALQLKEEVSKHLIAFDSQFSKSFSHAKADISRLSSWVFYLNKRNEDVASALKTVEYSIKTIENKENTSKERILANKEAISVLREELENNKKWLSYINNRLNSIEAAILKVNTPTSLSEGVFNQLADLKAEVARLDFEVKHQKTMELKTMEIPPAAPTHSLSSSEARPVIKSDIQLHDVIGISSSEKSILKILYLAETSLTYSHISNKTGLNYGTVKNLICKLRKKGFSIEDQVSPQGEKEFFLTSQAKIALSGR